jgi:hypothetical protein
MSGYVESASRTPLSVLPQRVQVIRSLGCATPSCHRRLLTYYCGPFQVSFFPTCLLMASKHESISPCDMALSANQNPGSLQFPSLRSLGLLW